MFSMMLNFAFSIIFIAVPSLDNSLYDMGASPDNSKAVEFNTINKVAVVPNGEASDQLTSNFKVLDMINLGFLNKIVEWMGSATKYMFGMIYLLDMIFGKMLIASNSALYDILFGGFGAHTGVLYIMMGVMYGYAIMQMWTGRNFGDGA